MYRDEFRNYCRVVRDTLSVIVYNCLRFYGHFGVAFILVGRGEGVEVFGGGYWLPLVITVQSYS